MINFKVQPSYADYKAANWLIFRKIWLSLLPIKIFGYLIAILSIIIFLQICLKCEFEYSYFEYALKEALVPAISIPIFLVLIFAFGMHFSIRKTFKALGTVELETSYSFSAVGLFSECEIGTSKLEWRHFTDFLHNQRLLVLRRTAYMIILIPLDQLPADTSDKLIQLLREGGVRET